MRIEYWGDTLALADAIVERIALIDAESGEFLSTFGRKGAGPGEFQWITDIFVGDDDVLRVLDGRSRRVSAFARSGTIEWETRLGELRGAPWTGIALRDRHLFTTLPAQAGVVVVSETMQFQGLQEFVWFETFPISVIKTARIAKIPQQDVWAVGFTFGPGFIVYRDGVGTSHPFVEEVPFHAPITREMASRGEDVVDYAARSVDLAGERIFFLFGGQPKRVGNPTPRPTRWLDIYEISGDYSESWLLPGGSRDFTTDGKRVFVIQYEPEYAVLGLSPVRTN